MIHSFLNPPFTVVKGQVECATGAGSPQEGVYQASIVDGLDRTSVDAQWGQSWFRRQVSIVVADVDGQSNLDLSLEQNALRISNGESIQIDIPLGPGPFTQQEAFPALTLPMRKIDFEQTGSKAKLTVNDGQVNYTIRNGLICQTD